MNKKVSMMSRLYGEVKKNGITNTYYKVKERRYKDLTMQDYDSERLSELPSTEELDAQRRRRNFIKKIRFSIVVPTYHTPELFLRQMIESVLNQTFSGLELCIADGSSDDSVEHVVREYQEKDTRVKYCRLSENRGISENTNEALKLAEGEYVGLLDHDDLLEAHALYEMRMAIAKNPKADVLYSDEDKVNFDLTHYFDPHRKPAFNPDLLRSNNYICHFLVVRRALLEKTGGFRSGYDGAQDFDLVLRLTETAECVVHIPKVLYHWRSHEASTASNPMSKLYAYEAGRRAVESHLERCKEPGIVSDTRFYGFYRVDYQFPIDFSADVVFFSANDKNHKKILNNFLDDFRGQMIGNVIYYDNEFNKFVIFSGVSKLESDIVVFADSSLSGFSETGLQQLVQNCRRPGIAAAGGKIVSSEGILVGGRMEKTEDGGLKCVDEGLPKGFTGYFHKAILQQNTDGVSYRLFAVRRSLLEEWQQSCAAENKMEPETIMADLCAFVQEKGYRIAYVPCASAVIRNKEG